MKKNIDWQNLDFSYRDSDCHIRYAWRNGAWDEGKLYSKPTLDLHIAATVLHYGQTVFEGMKAFECEDGTINIFRPQENAQRINRGARRLCMPEVPEDLFLNAVKRVVQANRDYVPPYGTGGSLYIRPLLFGSGPRIGVQPADEYIFMVLVLPVGPYYHSGLKPVRAVVLDDYDRAAPLGVGDIKAAGNYAASLEPHHKAIEQGFAVELYLDAKEHRFVEEFGTSNFIAITADGRYVTTASRSILPSVTNMTLQQIAKDMGIPVEIRAIEFDELQTFSEIAACGTAVVITPVNEIVRGTRVIRSGPEDGCGPVFSELYNRVMAIQYGDAPDLHDWRVSID